MIGPLFSGIRFAVDPAPEYHHGGKEVSTMAEARTGMVHVRQGINGGSFPFGGEPVGSVKRYLRELFSIHYYAEAYVNRKAVTLDHVLTAGDHLEFRRAFGYKAAKDEPREEIEAHCLLKYYPDLVKIGKEVLSLGLDAEKSINLMAERVARWCEDHFGPITSAVVPTLEKLVSELTALIDRLKPSLHGKQPRKVGRKPTTRGLADFAQAHPDLTYKEIADRWNKKHPNDKKVTEDHVRGAKSRAYGSKSRPAKKKRVE
jgi:hypothetical protein